MQKKRAKKQRFRSAKTGRFVSREYARLNPDTTIAENRESC